MTSGHEPVGPLDAADRDAVERQLGRRPRGLRSVMARDAVGAPTVVCTHPRLPDGTPFPTLYYLTAPGLVSAASSLESEGLMRELTERVEHDADFAMQYRRAHECYLAERDALEPLGTDVSAGGMPNRVKCLHVHLAHSLAVGPGTNPVGDELRDLIIRRWPEHREAVQRA